MSRQDMARVYTRIRSLKPSGVPFGGRKASATAWTVGVRSLSLPASVLYELDASPLLWFKWLTNVTEARMQCQYSHTSDQYTWSPAIVGEPIVLHHCAHQVGIQAVQAARG